MGKKTCQKFITLTAVAMFVLMIAFVATMFVTIQTEPYETSMASSEFINGIVDGDIKLQNEEYPIEDVTCTVADSTESIDLSSISGSDTEIKNELIDRMGYTVLSEEKRANGDNMINIASASDKTFDLKWNSDNSFAKMIWFTKHPTAKDFLDMLEDDYYSENGITYDINDVVLFPVLLFVFGIAGAILAVVFRKYGFFLIFPILWSVIGLISYISGFVGLAAAPLYIFSILKEFASGLFVVQFVITVLVLLLSVVSIIFRKKLKKVVAAEEAEYLNQL